VLLGDESVVDRREDEVRVVTDGRACVRRCGVLKVNAAIRGR
jgi:hypothetical protein